MRAWAFLLVLICTLNAFSASVASFFSDPNDQQNSSISSIFDSNFPHIINADLINSEHGDSDHDDSDCGQQHKGSHQCHLGHCNFILSGISKILSPDFLESLQKSKTIRSSAFHFQVPTSLQPNSYKLLPLFWIGAH